MFYLIREKSNIGMKIITDKHPVVQEHLKEADKGWNAERIIQWLWGFEKKADNVFDLIDKGDLIKLDYTNYPFSEEPFTFRFVDNLTFKDIHFNEDIIAAIYKPDSKGNFIKVWDKYE